MVSGWFPSLFRWVAILAPLQGKANKIQSKTPVSRIARHRTSLRALHVILS